MNHLLTLSHGDLPVDPMSTTPSQGIVMEPLGEVNNPARLDPVALGFMCGLEIHQQLATDKLHSRICLLYTSDAADD